MSAVQLGAGTDRWGAPRGGSAPGSLGRLELAVTDREIPESPDAESIKAVVSEERGPWARQHHPWTVEGEIEDFGRFARGITSQSGWKGRVGRVVVLFQLALLVSGVLVVLVAGILRVVGVW